MKFTKDTVKTINDEIAKEFAKIAKKYKMTIETPKAKFNENLIEVTVEFGLTEVMADINNNDKLFLYTAHKEYWNWLANNPNKSKHEWPLWDINGGYYDSSYNMCLACLYAGENECHSCPLEFPTERCYKDNGLLTLYLNAKSNELKSKYALEIAELKVKDSVNWI